MPKKDGGDVHVRLCDAAKAELDAIADAEGKTRIEIASEIVQEALLGRSYRYRLAAEKYICAGFRGIRRDER